MDPELPLAITPNIFDLILCPPTARSVGPYKGNSTGFPTHLFANPIADSCVASFSNCFPLFIGNRDIPSDSTNVSNSSGPPIVLLVVTAKDNSSLDHRFLSLTLRYYQTAKALRKARAFVRE